MIQNLQVNHFYTTPASIRRLMKAERDKHVDLNKYDLSSLKTIGSGNDGYMNNNYHFIDIKTFVFSFSWGIISSYCLELVLRHCWQREMQSCGHLVANR